MKVLFLNIVCILASFIVNGQFTFLEDHLLEYKLREITGPVILSNDNIALLTIEDNTSLENSRVQGIYLFDRCGQFIERVQFQNIDSYAEFYNIAVYNDQLLISGLEVNEEGSLFHSFILLDQDNLDVIKHKKYSSLKFQNQFTTVHNDTIYYCTANRKSVSTAVLDGDLNRMKYIERTFYEEDLDYINGFYADHSRMYYTKEYDDGNYYSRIGVADYALNEIAILESGKDSLNVALSNPLIANDSTFYIFSSVYNVDEIHLLKYVNNTLRDKVRHQSNFTFSGVHYTIEDDKLKLLKEDGRLLQYDLSEGSILSDEQVVGDTLIGYHNITTDDGGLLTARQYWEYKEAQWYSYIRLVQLNTEYSIDTTVDNPCIDNVTDEKPLVNFSIYGNPNVGTFTIVSDEDIDEIAIYTTTGQQVDYSLDRYDNKRYNIRTNYTGLAIVSVRSGSKLSTQKVIIY